MANRKTHSALLDYITTRAWALEESVGAQLQAVVMRHVAGTSISQDELDEIVAARDAKTAGRKVEYEVSNGTAVIPVTGVIAKHASQVNNVSQPRGTATTDVADMLKRALADESVRDILLAIDSPGGAVDGVQALADHVFNARGKKPITALADGQMCSAAYWIGSQADKVMATPDAVVGSIGVYATAADVSRAAKNEGIEVTVVRSGAHKGAGTPGTALSPEHVAGIQRTVDSYATLFRQAVARGRGSAIADVSAVATGAVWIGAQAQDVGLIDGVATLEQVLGSSSAASPVKAESSADTGQVYVWDGARTDLSTSTITGMTAADVPQAVAVSLDGKDMDPKTNAAEPRPLTTQDVVEKHPGAADALRAEGAQLERKRIAAIREMAAKGQEALVDKLVAEGADENKASRDLLADLKARNSTTLQALQQSAPKSVGNDDVTFTEGKAAKETPAIAADDFLGQAKAAYAADPSLAREFGEEKYYAAFLEQQAGRRAKGGF